MSPVERRTGAPRAGNHPPKDIAPNQCELLLSPAASRDPAREMNWRRRLEAYYVQIGLDHNAIVLSSNRARFDDKMCDLVVEFHPEVVSFHFGLPDRNLLHRVRSAGAKILSTATSVDEAHWLEDQGCDAIIAQGFEAG